MIKGNKITTLFNVIYIDAFDIIQHSPNYNYFLAVYNCDSQQNQAV